MLAQEKNPTLEIVEIRVMDYKGLTARLQPAYAIGFEGKAIIDGRTQQPIGWARDRAEVEKKLEELLSEESSSNEEEIL